MSRQRAGGAQNPPDDVGASLLRALPFGFEVVAPDGTLLYVSDLLEREFGKGAVGKKCWEVYRADGTQCDECPLRGGVAEGETKAIVSHGGLDGRCFEIHHTGMVFEGRQAVLQVFHDITERAQAEADRLRSEAKLEVLIGQLPAVLWTVDRELRFTSSGGAGLAALGLEPGQAVGMSLYEYFRTDDPGFEAIAQHLKALEGEHVSYEFEWAGNAYEVHVEPLHDAQGAIAGVIGLAVDVTERRQAERMERLTQFAIDRVGDAAYWMDSDGKFFYVNEAACRFLGYSSAELQAMKVSDIDPNIPARLWPEFWESLRTKRANTLESQHRTKTGRMVPVEIAANWIEFGDTEYCIAFARDITDRKRSEESLRRSESKYRGLVDHANYGIYRSSPEGRFLSVNPALVEMLGYDSEAELLALDLERDVYATRDERPRLIQRYRERGRIDGLEVDWKRKDGTPLTVRLSGRPMHNDIGQLESFEMFVEDVSERRTLEAQLRQAQKMEAIGQLTGGIAHDFNNLLSVITLNAQMVTSALETESSDLLPEVQDIQEAARKAARMTKQLLGFSRHADLQLAPTDLAHVVTDLTSMLRRVLPESIHVRIAADDAVPAVRADAGAVEQILFNLATNARDAMPEGGTLHIEVQQRAVGEVDASPEAWLEPGSYVVIAVSDTGIGMDDATRARVFEPFFTTKAPGVGTGLGMAMVYGLTKQHGGFVGVESELGKGSTIELYFPVAAGAALAPASRDPTELIRGGTETILLVEDEDTLRRSAKRVLERHGYRVLGARDGLEALEIYRANKAEIDLVISDLVMPKLGGGQLFRALRQEGGDVPFILASGYAGPHAHEREDLEPEFPILQKPWALSDLLERVRDTLDR